MLSGSRSLISTNSSAWIFRTSLAGMGGTLDARWNGGVLGPACADGDVMLGGTQEARGLVVGEGNVSAEPADTEGCKRGMLVIERGC